MNIGTDLKYKVYLQNIIVFEVFPLKTSLRFSYVF